MRKVAFILGMIPVAWFCPQDALALPGKQPMSPATINQSPEIERHIGYDQHLGESLDMTLKFLDEIGATVTLGSVFPKKQPVLMAFAYYDCQTLCSMVLDSLFVSLSQMPYQAGKDYSLVVVSIDPDEGASLAHETKERYLKRYPDVGQRSAIHFLTGEKASIVSLTKRAGFRYRRINQTGEYAHAAGAVIVGSGGVISRYLFGLKFPLRDLRLAMVDASQGKVGSIVDKFLLYCYRYNPANGTYSFVIYRALQAGGALIVFLLALLIGGMLRSERSKGLASS